MSPFSRGRCLRARRLLPKLGLLLTLAVVPSQGAAQEGAGWMTRHDLNRDGAIQREEAPPAVARAFDRLDRDSDGALSVRELLAGREALRSRTESSSPSSSTGSGSPAGVEAADAAIRDLIATEQLGGAGIVVRRIDTDEDVFRSFYGEVDPDTRLPIASATKWFTGVTVAAALERFGGSLDAPVSQCMPDLGQGKGAFTVRQALSHVSGLPSLGPGAERAHPDLAASARAQLAAPPAGAPGEVFIYSGSAMQVASHCAEVVSGQPFRTLFDSIVVRPLGLTGTGFAPEGAPITGGGLWSTTTDLERFTAMIANRGRHGASRILSETAFDDFRRRVSPGGARIVEMPDSARTFSGMATGMWCERVASDGLCSVVSSIGAFGTYAWVDFEAGLYGVFFVRSRLPVVWPTWVAVRGSLGSR